MESLIPKLFILTVEASVVLLLIVILILFFQRKNKKKDLQAVRQLVFDIKENQAFRIKGLSSQLKKNNYSGDVEEKSNELHSLEKKFLQESLNIYLNRDIYRLDNVPSSLHELTDEFMKLLAGTSQEAPETAPINKTDDKLIEQAKQIKESNLKEVNELRLKNTELNEHLFEALETITGLVTEHSKAHGGNDKPSAQQILDAIIYLRDQRTTASGQEPSATPQPAFASAPIPEEKASPPNQDSDGGDETIFAESTPDLGISDILNADLESDLNEDEGNDDPWADALAEQAVGEDKAEAAEEDDPWAAALAEQDAAEIAPEETATSQVEEEDPWADALAEQSAAEAAPKETAASQAEEEDPWAAALEEQSAAEAAPEETAASQAEEEDPWADALAEQSAAEAAPEETATSQAEEDPWAAALEEQSAAEAAPEETANSEAEEDPWAAALEEQSAAESAADETVSNETDEEEDPWAAALAEQKESEQKDKPG